MPDVESLANSPETLRVELKRRVGGISRPSGYHPPPTHAALALSPSQHVEERASEEEVGG